jgi:AcrR family transcriptional regulator
MPISDCEVRDPRIRRTRQMLQTALSTLLQSRTFDEISVQDITDAATINRATFYDHYTDKYTLFAALIAGGFHAMLHKRNVCYQGPGTEGPLILAVCDFLLEINEKGCDRQTAFEPLKDAAIVDAIQKVLRNSPQPPDEIAAAAASWSIYGAAREWLKKPNRQPAKEFVLQVQAMVEPILAVAEKITAHT